MGLFDFIGGLAGSLIGKSTANDQMGMQTTFAKKGIQWRVEDAEKAGIHPLYALGAQTPTYTPVSTPDYAAVGSQLGQNLDTAISKHFTAEGKAGKILTALSIERAQLENDKLRSEIRMVNSPGQPPSLPSPMDNVLIGGQGDSRSDVRMVPPEITASQGMNPAAQAGAINDYQYARTNTGYTIVPSKDMKSAIEDQIVPEMAWSFRNMHIVTPPPDRSMPPKEWLPKNADIWKWNPFKQEWQPARKGTIGGSYFVKPDGSWTNFGSGY